MLGWASQRKWPHLPWVISLLQAVRHLRWGGLGRGSGTGGSAETKASARRSGWHGREVTARSPPPIPRPPQHTDCQPLHKSGLSITLQVPDASSLSHGVHAFSTGQKCQRVMKGLIHGGWQRRRSWSSSRYDPDWCWWASLKMGAIIKCPCAITKFLSCSKCPLVLSVHISEVRAE